MAQSQRLISNLSLLEDDVSVVGAGESKLSYELKETQASSCQCVFECKTVVLMDAWEGITRIREKKNDIRERVHEMF